MNYTSFRDMFLDRLRAALPNFSDLQESSIQKNNGVNYTGIFLRPSGGTTVSPIIYLEPLYRRFVNGSPLEKLVFETVDLLQTGNGKTAPDLLEPSYLRTHVIFRLVGAGGCNASVPEKLLMRPFLDMFITYGVFLEETYMGQGLAVLTKELQPRIPFQEEELFTFALENTRYLMGEKLETMDRVLEDRLGCSGETKPEEMIYVLTNQNAFYGAATMIYGDSFRQLAAQHQADIFILPSSVHELILLPKTVEGDEKRLKALVTEVNRTEIRSEEVLTNSVYLYRRAEDRIVRCA